MRLSLSMQDEPHTGWHKITLKLVSGFNSYCWLWSTDVATSLAIKQRNADSGCMEAATCKRAPSSSLAAMSVPLNLLKLWKKRCYRCSLVSKVTRLQVVVILNVAQFVPFRRCQHLCLVNIRADRKTASMDWLHSGRRPVAWTFGFHTEPLGPHPVCTRQISWSGVSCSSSSSSKLQHSFRAA